MTAKARYRILLIDDQEAIHEDYRKILGPQLPNTLAVSRAAAELFDDDVATAIEWDGFDLSSAMQGQQGFELVQRSIEEGRPYAVAFVDIRMPPGWDGIETVRRIWEVDPEILVVICSAYSDYSWEDMVRQLGRNDRFLILKKPFDNIEVRQCAMALTERWTVSRTDVLTGLLNRRAFHGHLKLEWSRASEKNQRLSCVMVDLDYFKRINDTLGHQAGDVVLKGMADLLKAQCRTSDYLCRYGGEELCVLLPNADEDVAASWAERARGAIESATVMIGDQAVHATASFGVSEALGANDSMEQLIDRADQSLIVAKKLGRNRVVRASAIAESGSVMEQMRLHRALFEGVTAGDVMTSPISTLPVTATIGQAADLLRELHVHSVPVVDTHGRLVGVLSEKDLICTLSSHDAWNTPIERIMQRTFVSFEQHAPLSAISEFLSRVTVRRVFIVHNGAPIGVITQRNLLGWYARKIAVPEAAVGAEEVPPADPQRRQRLMEGAAVIAQCAKKLSETATGATDDPIAPMLEGVRRLQNQVDALVASTEGRGAWMDLTDSDSFPIAGLPIQPTS